MNVNLNLDRFHKLTPHQLLLLESLVGPSPEADLACQSWLQSVDFENIDFATYRLIPNLYARHIRGRPQFPNHGRIKGIYRFFHVRNTLLLADTRQAVAALHAAGITVVAFKGLAWALKYYERPAERAMMDADILVPGRDFALADAVLREHGWRYQHSDEHRRVADHSVDLVNEGGRAIDLHVRSLVEVRDDAFDQSVISRSQIFDWNGLPIRLPSPEHHVLIGLVNAMREPENFRLEWICDLARALTISESFDWSAVCELSHTYGVNAQLFEALCIASDLPGLNALRTLLPGLARHIPSPADSAPKGPDTDHSNSLNASQMRLFENHRGDIEALFMQWKFLPVLPRLFEIMDQTALEEAVRGLPNQGAGLLNFAPGSIKRRSGAIEPYQVKIEFADGGPPATLAPGARTIMRLRIINKSEDAWTIDSAKNFSYGVSWHVYRANGELDVWDMPRYYFLVPKEKHMVFIAPGMAVECPIEFVAPTVPGKYIIKLDIVHEGVSWFSWLAPKKNKFPKWRILVTNQSSPRYFRPNVLKVLLNRVRLTSPPRDGD